jgi:hypothetical protein
MAGRGHEPEQAGSYLPFGDQRESGMTEPGRQLQRVERERCHCRIATAPGGKRPEQLHPPSFYRLAPR